MLTWWGSRSSDLGLQRQDGHRAAYPRVLVMIKRRMIGLRTLSSAHYASASSCELLTGIVTVFAAISAVSDVKGAVTKKRMIT